MSTQQLLEQCKSTFKQDEQIEHETLAKYNTSPDGYVGQHHLAHVNTPTRKVY